MSLVVTLRTDKPEAEVGIYENGRQLGYHVWLAHRELSKTLHRVVRDELAKHDKTIHDIHDIIVFRGPGSFTGLRIGISVANTYAHELKARIVGVADQHQWLERGFQRLEAGENDLLVMPEYGAEAHITQQKK